MKSESGFTVLEGVIMAIVLVVIGIITYPQFRTMLYQSREGRTKASLGDLRSALAIYYSDNFGRYPSDEGTPETRLVAPLVPTYLQAIPHVELSHHHPERLNTVQNVFDGRGDWVYSMESGFIAVNSGRPDTKGELISNW